eukprot:14774421-Ditylum_brightwellii.AAC.1
MVRTLHSQNVGIEFWTKLLNKGRVTFAIDGSVATKQGYFAVVLHTYEESLHLQGPCDCHLSLISSYWMELRGILSALCLLKALSSYTSQVIAKKQGLYCNNISVINRTNTPLAPGIKTHTAPDHNVIQAIMKEKDSLSEFKVLWVKAHQDDMQPIEQLTLDS